jgi:[ribosomal protein S5]-alanine N-acetyltransferase
MKSIPELDTPRLLLRPFLPGDAADVQRMAGDRAIAATTLLIPHPYEDGMAEEWIATHAEDFQRGLGAVWAVTHKTQGFLIGAVGLSIKAEYKKAELGYWIGRQYWSNNYATEAGKAVLNYAFNDLALNRVVARHLGRNPASGRVMQKLGMTYEGCMRQDVIKWGQADDILVYSMLRGEHLSADSP